MDEDTIDSEFIRSAQSYWNSEFVISAFPMDCRW